jgi:hypothetical protein
VALVHYCGPQPLHHEWMRYCSLSK